MKLPLIGFIPPSKFIKTSKLVEDTITTVGFLSQIDERIKGIIGIPRSGLIPASILATNMHLPLFSIDKEGKLIQLQTGGRAENLSITDGKWLLVDDTCVSGTAIKKAAEKLGLSRDEYVSLAIYCDNLKSVDFGAFLYYAPHFLEWCFVNTFYAKHAYFDLDGIICEDWIDPKGEYTEFGNPDRIKFLYNAKPIYLPRKFPIKIITARPIAFAAITMQWLQKMQIKVEEIYFWEEHPDERWKHPLTVAEWKADILSRIKKRRHVNFYIESNPSQALAIMQLAALPVICPMAEEVFGWSDEKNLNILIE